MLKRFNAILYHYNAITFEGLNAWTLEHLNLCLIRANSFGQSSSKYTNMTDIGLWIAIVQEKNYFRWQTYPLQRPMQPRTKHFKGVGSHIKFTLAVAYISTSKANVQQKMENVGIIGLWREYVCQNGAWRSSEPKFFKGRCTLNQLSS